MTMARTPLPQGPILKGGTRSQNLPDLFTKRKKKKHLRKGISGRGVKLNRLV
jgi:hypothetical protein